MTLSNQATTVLQHMRDERYITSWAAEGVYRIRRLASRIDELVAAGYDIKKEPARDATGQRYTRYSLSGRQRIALYPINPRRTPKVRVSLERVEEALQEAGVCACVTSAVISNLKETA